MLVRRTCTNSEALHLRMDRPVRKSFDVARSELPRHEPPASVVPSMVDPAATHVRANLERRPSNTISTERAQYLRGPASAVVAGREVGGRTLRVRADHRALGCRRASERNRSLGCRLGGSRSRHRRGEDKRGGQAIGGCAHAVQSSVVSHCRDDNWPIELGFGWVVQEEPSLVVVNTLKVVETAR